MEGVVYCHGRCYLTEFLDVAVRHLLITASDSRCAQRTFRGISTLSQCKLEAQALTISASVYLDASLHNNESVLDEKEGPLTEVKICLPLDRTPRSATYCIMNDSAVCRSRSRDRLSATLTLLLL